MTIELQNLNKKYGKKSVLFEGNLEIPTGSFTMLRGMANIGEVRKSEEKQRWV